MSLLSLAASVALKCLVMLPPDLLRDLQVDSLLSLAIKPASVYIDVIR